MSATSRRDTSASPTELEDRDREVGLVGVHVHLQRLVVADDEHRVADLLEPRHERLAVEVVAGDREVRAVAEAARLVLGQVEVAARRHVLVLELEGVVARRAEPRSRRP